MTSNCETVTFWCTTGKWSTLQVSNALKTAKILGISGTGIGIAYVSAQTVTTTVFEVVAYVGLWGWLGYMTVNTVVYTTTLAAMQPWLIPVIAVSGSGCYRWVNGIQLLQVQKEVEGNDQAYE
jgi:hypothetical protein